MQEVMPVERQQEQEAASNRYSKVARPRSDVESADLGRVMLGSLERI